MSLKRQSDILHAVRESGSYSITDLAERLAVSTETIRRNIRPLIENGSLLRFHGGIMDPDHQDEPPFQRRMQVNRESKRRVAALVRGMIHDGDSLILDNGTTTTYVAEALRDHSGLVAVTNSAQIACRLSSRNNNRVFMAGGELSGDDAAAFGAGSLDFLRQFEVKYALISVAGVTGRGDLVDFHLFEAEFSRAAMKQARETWVIADTSKFGRDAPVRVCDLAAIDVIVSDGAPSPEFARLCRQADVRLVTPP
ncbi:DeoR/GlpR family DNA-binding transcription regulator [Ancylobacter lacus]|uniref:DeoR/GlpR family DNA-binding transcription regulator n=1 Tax=Ancylobacter lacus TaxID=2579970 RepID=UPI001BCE194E|nr:DeoR/GlpR family DNA-binding transcription regulator [Ancylobacter lacus]MBS7537975.1 DeoR/GlpR transcriptional regulator [Ancylobacter lacus]